MNLMSIRTSKRVIGVVCVIFSGLESLATAEVPILIQHQPLSIQRAWAEIDKIVVENEKLPEPLPEPYVARGDLWSRVGGHEDALSDYLKATELFFRSNPSPGEQARHLLQLRRSLDAVVQQPRPRYPNDAASEYSLGLNASRRGDHNNAEFHFAEATRLMPSVALYRVHRALALRELGKNDDGRRQVAIALSLIRESGSRASDEMQLLQRGLEHVQGPSRLWLSRELDLTVEPAVKKRL